MFDCLAVAYFQNQMQMICLLSSSMSILSRYRLVGVDVKGDNAQFDQQTCLAYIVLLTAF